MGRDGVLVILSRDQEDLEETVPGFPQTASSELLWLQVIIPSATLGHEKSELNWSRLHSPVVCSAKQP